MPPVAFQLNDIKKMTKQVLWSSLLSTNRLRKISGKEKSGDRYQLCLPTIIPLKSLISMDTPAEIDDHQFPEVFNMQRVKPLLAEKAMIQHNIALSLQAALELKKAAVANIKTKKQ